MRAARGSAEGFAWRMLWLSLLLVALPGMGTDMFFSSLRITVPGQNASTFRGVYLLPEQSIHSYRRRDFC